MNIQLIIRRSHCLHRKTSLFHQNFVNIRSLECCRNKQSSTTSVDEVIIPERINRSPTDILEALASTVSRDFTAPHYKFLDDPYLIPRKSAEVRAFALAKESGRKAAHYFIDNYPDLFFRDTSEPKIPAYTFKEIYDENTDVNEDDLYECICLNDVPNSIIAYNNLKAKGCTLSENTVQNLLELVCFYNSSEPSDYYFTEESWFENKRTFEQMNQKWNDYAFAEQLFNDIKNKNAKTFVTLLLGYTKYFNAKKAFKLHEEMMKENIVPTVDAYNGLIENVVLMKESGESRWEMVIHLLQEMNNNKVRPNVNTFNACLFVLKNSLNWRKSGDIALQLFGEMKKLKIRPCLASYHFLLLILMKRNQNLGVLYEIINELEGKQFSLRHKYDAHFLELAMQVCLHHLSDLELGYRIHNLLNIGNNHKFFRSAQFESIYYRHFFMLLALCETTENLFEVYNKYVPNVYQPETSVFIEILKNIELGESYSYAPQLYSDVSTFKHLFHGNMVQAWINFLSKKKQEDNALQLQFVEIAWNLLQTVMDRNNKSNFVPIEITSEMWDNLLKIFINGDDLQKADFVVNYIEEKHRSNALIPSADTLIDYCRLSAKQKRPENIVNCIALAGSIGLQDVIAEVVNNKKDYSLDDEVLKAMNLGETKSEAESGTSSEDETSSDSSSESSDSSSEN